MEVTIAEQVWTDAFGALMAQIADCFPRREPRLVAREMVQTMLMELDSYWSGCVYRGDHLHLVAQPVG